jgi:hypothetical protein
VILIKAPEISPADVSSAIEILSEAEAFRREGLNKTLALVPSSAGGAVHCLAQAIEHEHPLASPTECRKLLDAASRAFDTFRVKALIAHVPFDIFWGNPNEPKHSRLLEYFIHPRAEHRCGLFLLRKFLSALNIIDPGLPVDDACDVTCEKGHIDLLVARGCEYGRYAIIIENKVNGAVDRKKQLQTYYDVVRRRGFADKEITVCYLTLRGGEPSEDSVGNIGHRLKLITFERQVVRWLEDVLRDEENWPDTMGEGMADNLRHYLELIKWLLNKEKIMQMNERLFEALQKADKENRLPRLTEITALKESAQALESCYRRLVRAKMLSAVCRLLLERDGLKATHAYHDGWSEPTGEDDLRSTEYWYGFSIGDLIIVAIGEDSVGVYTGYCMPTNRGKEVKLFNKFVCGEDPSVFGGTSNDRWYSYEYEQVDGSRPEDTTHLADKALQMFRRMEHLVTKFSNVAQKPT